MLSLMIMFSVYAYGNGLNPKMVEINQPIILFFDSSNFKSAENILRSLLDKRDKFCENNIASCLDTKDLSKALCSINPTLHLKWAQLTWRRLFAHVTTETDALKQLDNLATCSENNNISKFIGYLSLLERESQLDLVDLSQKQVILMKAQWPKLESDDLKAGVVALSHAIFNLDNSNAMARGVRHGLQQLVSKWIPKESIKDVPSPVLVEWSNILINITNQDSVIDFLSITDLLTVKKMSAESYPWAFSAVRRRCIDLALTGKTMKRCKDDLKYLVQESAPTPSVQIRAKLLFAYYFEGTSSSIEKLISQAQTWNATGILFDIEYRGITELEKQQAKKRTPNQSLDLLLKVNKKLKLMLPFKLFIISDFIRLKKIEMDLLMDLGRYKDVVDSINGLADFLKINIDALRDQNYYIFIKGFMSSALLSDIDQARKFRSELENLPPHMNPDKDFMKVADIALMTLTKSGDEAEEARKGISNYLKNNPGYSVFLNSLKKNK